VWKESCKFKRSQVRLDCLVKILFIFIISTGENVEIRHRRAVLSVPGDKFLSSVD
jgi:hypothetical protein